MMKVSINKNVMLVEIMFSSNITWNHCNFGSKVHLEYLGLPTNTNVLTKQSEVYLYDSVKSLYSIGRCNYRFQLSTTNNNTFGWPAEKYKREKTWQTMEQEYYSHLSNIVMPLSQSLRWLAEQWISSSSCLQHLLQIYKNKIHKKADIDKEIPNWMKWSHKQNHSNRGVLGWIILDEMSVQADLQFYSRENKTYLIGFNDMDSESPFVENIKTIYIKERNQKFN